MKQTIVQISCDRCGKPTRGDEVTIRRRDARLKTIDVCPRHMRSVMQVLALSTTEAGRVLTTTEIEEVERKQEREKDIAEGEASTKTNE